MKIIYERPILEAVCKAITAAQWANGGRCNISHVLLTVAEWDRLHREWRTHQVDLSGPLKIMGIPVYLEGTAPCE